MILSDQKIHTYCLPYDEDDKSYGCWWFINKRTVCIRCPECGVRHVMRDHKVAAIGFITPHIICRMPDCRCRYHAMLMDWPGNPDVEPA